MAVLLLIILVLTVMSAYFAASETAMMALNRYRLRHLAIEGHGGARKANELLQRPDRLLGVILVGNNVVIFSPHRLRRRSPTGWWATRPARSSARSC